MLASVGLFAQEQGDCPNIDLRQTLGPKINQGEIGWCYAISMGHLLTARYGHKASFVHLAMLYNNAKYKKQKFLDRMFSSESIIPESKLEYGYSDELLQLVKNQGYYCKGYPRPEFDLEHALNGVENIYQDYVRDKQINICDQSGESILDSMENLFPNVDLLKVSQVCENSDALNFLDNLAQASCEKVEFSQLDWKQVEKGFFETVLEKKEAYSTAILQQLVKGQLASVMFTGNVLSNPEEKVPMGSHATTIVGQRYNNSKQRCEYLLHDSIDEKFYNQIWEKDEDLLWFPKDKLLSLTIGVIYLD